jgi:hypothetical protein
MGDYNYLFGEMPMLDDLLRVEQSFMPVSSEILADTVDVLRAHLAGPSSTPP